MAVTGTDAGAFRHGLHNGPAITDYDPSLEQINSFAQGAAGGGYTIRAGDTLAGIALALWGDASLWYKLAEANGLTGASGLIEGRNLVIPHGIQSNHHNAGTLKPYDPAETLGDTSPTTPKPQKKGNKCGMFGQILLVIVAVAVSALTYGAMAPHMAGLAGTVLAGAVSGAAGSVFSQAFGVATGIQDKFSWKGVAMAAIAGGVSGGIGHALGQAGIAGSKILTGIVRGAASSAITQGIGVALGLQKKFDFAGVAAAGVGGGIMGAIGAQPLDKNNSFANHMTHAGAGAASAIANATTRSLINGTDFGDNLIAALPDIIGSTIGNMVAYGVGGATSLGSRSKPSFSDAELASPNADPASMLARLPNVDLGSELSDPQRFLLSLTERSALEWQVVPAGVTIGGPTPGRQFGPEDVTARNLEDLVGKSFYLKPPGADNARWVQNYQGAPRPSFMDAELPAMTQGDIAALLQLFPITDLGGTGQSAGTKSTLWLPIGEQALPGSSRRTAPITGIPYNGKSYAYWPGSSASNQSVGKPRFMSNDQMAVHIDRLRGGSFGGIGYGTAHSLGLSEAAQNLWHGIGQSLDGFALGFALRPNVNSVPAPLGRPTITRPLTRADGAIYWPGNDGFIGTGLPMSLRPRTFVDRHGYEDGSFLSPLATPAALRALEPGTTRNKPYAIYEVMRPLDVTGGRAAPWFGQPGGGGQFKVHGTIKDAEHQGYLARRWPPKK